MASMCNTQSVSPRLRWNDLIAAMAGDEALESPEKKERFMRYYLEAPFDDIYLTRREFQTLVALLEGGSLKTIARARDISVRTVEEYVKNLRKKLGFVSKQEMVSTLLACNYLVSLKVLCPKFC